MTLLTYNIWLVGIEKVCYLPLEYLEEIKAYNTDIDAAFYQETSVSTQEMQLGNVYFAIFFPQDGHMQGLSESCNEKAKKIVVKVQII